MKKRSIILLGGGGHSKSAIDLIISTGEYSIDGIIDVKEKVGTNVLGIPIIGSDEDLDSIRKNFYCFAVTIGQIQSASIRKRFFERLISLDAELPVIIASSSHISPFAIIGKGSMIFHHVILNAGARIGENCIINNQALIEHDVAIGNHCHISTAAVINGGVKIGDGCFIGSNATIRQGVTIDNDSVIGAGSVVIKNVGPNVIVGGVPAKTIRKNA